MIAFDNSLFLRFLCKAQALWKLVLGLDFVKKQFYVWCSMICWLEVILVKSLWGLTFLVLLLIFEIVDNLLICIENVVKVVKNCRYMLMLMNNIFFLLFCLFFKLTFDFIISPFKVFKFDNNLTLIKLFKNMVLLHSFFINDFLNCDTIWRPQDEYFLKKRNCIGTYWRRERCSLFDFSKYFMLGLSFEGKFPVQKHIKNNTQSPYIRRSR